MSITPMFPLGTVLLPGAVLPLHVFEPRYRRLVDDCVESSTHEFGVVLIERGSEVGGGEVRREVGTMARMVQVAELPDGRCAVVAVGTRRIRVRAWLPDDPYPIADVDDWPEAAFDEADVVAAIDALSPRVRRTAALALELGDATREPSADISDDPLLATHHLVDLAPVGDRDRYDLLCAPGPIARLALLAERLDDVETLLRFRLDTP